MVALDESGSDGILEKSRDMGASWLSAAYAVHSWLFVPGSAIGFGSRKLEYVDRRDDPKSIFDKIRTIIRNLPPWLINDKATGFTPKRHDHYCKIINPANGSTITAEGGANIGRGGRTTRYFVDEAAFLFDPVSADEALSANTRSRVDISTPNGSNNPFATKRFSGNYPVFTLHWKNDPRRQNWIIVPKDWEAEFIPPEPGKTLAAQELKFEDSDIIAYGTVNDPIPPLPPDTRLIYPWKEWALLKYGPHLVAKEFEIDYTASLEGVACPARWLRACVGLQLPDNGIDVAGWDVAGGGANENAYFHRKGSNMRRMVSWHDMEPTDAAFKAVRLAEEDQVKGFYYDSVGVGSFVGGTIKKLGRKPCFKWAGVNTGIAPTKTKWPDGRTSAEMFDNLKAEIWWRFRLRVEKTWLYVERGIVSPPDQMLSLVPGPDTDELIAQLSNVLSFETLEGKIRIETKKELADRGVKSPDKAEAVILSFAPVPLTSSTTRKPQHGDSAKAKAANFKLTAKGHRRRGNSA